MTITPHFFAGAAIANLTDNVLVAFLLGFFLHFVLDALPHVDPGTFNEIKIPLIDFELEFPEGKRDKPWPRWIYYFAITEFLIVVTTFFFLFHHRANFTILSAGAFGGIFVDILDNPIFRFILKLPVFRQIHWLHHRVHHDLDPKKWYWGLPVQLIIIGVSLWVLLK
jgi:hypothetical protein